MFKIKESVFRDIVHNNSGLVGDFVENESCIYVENGYFSVVYCKKGLHNIQSGYCYLLALDDTDGSSDFISGGEVCPNNIIIFLNKCYESRIK